MLKLKKTHLHNQTTTQISTENDSLFLEQTQALNSLTTLNQKHSLTHQNVITHLQTYSSSSISTHQFLQLLTATLNPNNLQSPSHLVSAQTILLKLISLPHDPKQLKTFIKKQKSIDPLLLLSILWDLRSNQSTWKYVTYMIQCFPAQMILTGKEYLFLWQGYFEECERKTKINEELKGKIREKELLEKLKKQIKTNSQKGFVDTFINL